VRPARVFALALLLTAPALGAGATPEERAALEERADYVVHTLQRGQTLWARADQHGVEVDEIVRLNRIENVRRVPVGLRLVISKTRDPDRIAVDEQLAQAEWALRSARFEEALASSEQARELLAPLGEDAGTRARLGHLELVAASVAIAFGREDEALARVESALAANAALPVHADLVSPKVLAVVREAERRQSVRDGP